MTHKLLVHSSNILSNDSITINVYVTEDKITFRYLEETFKDPTTDEGLLSHTLMYGINHMTRKNEEAVFKYQDKNLKLLYEDSIDFEEVKNTWKAGQVCFICAPAYRTTCYKSSEIRKLNVYSETYATKNSFGEFADNIRAFTGYGAFLYFFPLKDQNFLTSSCRLICNTPETLITNLNFTETAARTDTHLINLFYNKVGTQTTIKGSDTISSNGSETLEVEVSHEGTLLSEPLILKVECVDGYAPHQRVEIVDGKGSFKVTALGLEPGETMRVKLNDDCYTSKAEHIFKVI